MTAPQPQTVEKNPAGQPAQAPPAAVDPLLTPDELVPVKADAAKRTLKRALSELNVFIAGNRWEDAVDLFHPVDEKLPEVAAHGLDAPVRAKIAFSMGHLGRYDDAMAELTLCIAAEPDNFHHHSSMAYTAYNSLYAARNREIFLSGGDRADRIRLAHTHFQAAQELRPDGITNFYRQGMLYKQIEGKPAEAVPRFERAVANWDALTPDGQQAAHQQKKNFIKSLYQLASALLDLNRADESLSTLKRCLAEDERSNHIGLPYKYFALGKVHYHLNRFPEAKEALLFALRAARGGPPMDFVHELLGRVHIALDQPEKALEAVRKVPEKRRRPYIRWTEADALCAAGDLAGAKRVLLESQERDKRSRHKSLVRLAKIAFLAGEFAEALEHGEAANAFFQEKWGNICDEGVYWQAAAALRLGSLEEARELADTLAAHRPGYPKLGKLMAALKS